MSIGEARGHMKTFIFYDKEYKFKDMEEAKKTYRGRFGSADPREPEKLIAG